MNETKMSLPCLSRGYLMALPRKVTCFTRLHIAPAHKSIPPVGIGRWVDWMVEEDGAGRNLRRLISLERSIKAIFIPFCLL